MSPAGHLSVERRLNVQSGLHKFLVVEVSTCGSPGGNANLITSVAPCDQSRTEKVSLGSLGGFQLGCGSGMVGGGDYLPLLRKIAVLELKTWDSERVPSCAAPHCLRVLWFWMFLGSCAASKFGLRPRLEFSRALGRPKVPRFLRVELRVFVSESQFNRVELLCAPLKIGNNFRRLIQAKVYQLFGIGWRFKDFFNSCQKRLGTFA